MLKLILNKSMNFLNDLRAKKTSLYLIIVMVNISLFAQQKGVSPKIISLQQALTSINTLNESKKFILLDTESEKIIISKTNIELISNGVFSLSGTSENGDTLKLIKNKTRVYGHLIKKNSSGYIIDQNKKGKVLFSKTTQIFNCYPKKKSSDLNHKNKTDDNIKQSARTNAEYRRFIGNANTTTDPRKLQSRPDVTSYTIYLWFDPSKKTSPEYERFIWEQVADDWLPFKVNITTDRSIYSAAPEGDRARVNFTEYFAAGGGSPCYINKIKPEVTYFFCSI